MLLGVAVVVVLAIGALAISRRAVRQAERRVGDLAGILGMDGRRFDAFVARLYRKDGWWAFEPHAAAERGGDDIRLERGGETWLVRARNWRYRQVSAADVRDFYSLIAERGDSGGFYVTTSRFNPEAQTFARRVPRTRPLGLIDADELLTWAQRGRRPSRADRSAPPQPVLDAVAPLDPPAFAQQVLEAWKRQGYEEVAIDHAAPGLVALERAGERLLVRSLAAAARDDPEAAAGPLAEAVARGGNEGVLVAAVAVPSELRRRLRDQRVDVIEGPALARFLAAGAGNTNNP